MSQFSTSRSGDRAAAVVANAQLQPAINALTGSRTAANRMNHLEAFELLQWMVNNNFAVSYNSVALTSAQLGS